MKKIIIITLFCFISIYAQENGGADDILINAKKDYLYHLQRLNIGTTLRFVEAKGDDGWAAAFIRSELDREFNGNWPFKKENSIDIDLKTERKDKMKFWIQEEKHLLPDIEARVYLLLLKNTNGFTKKSGGGRFDNGPSTYRWTLKDNLLIFVSTWHFDSRSSQKYVYVPDAE